MKRRIVVMVMMALVLGGCAGFNRGCSSWTATNFGSDWVVVQYGFDGTPINAWKLSNVSISNESASDGIYWKDNTTGHLVHIAGWYNRVQVEGGRFEEAAKLLGIDYTKVVNGKYANK